MQVSLHEADITAVSAYLDSISRVVWTMADISTIQALSVNGPHIDSSAISIRVIFGGQEAVGVPGRLDSFSGGCLALSGRVRS